MTSTLMEMIRLDNGLQLNLYDSSQKTAGDHWRVSVTARIEIPVHPQRLRWNEQDTLDLNAVRSALGDRIVFEKIMDRHFIPDHEKEGSLSQLRNFLVDTVLKYWSLPDFPKKYVYKRYREHQQRRSWYPS